MPTINGVPNYPKPVENRTVPSQEDQTKKADDTRVAQKAADDAVIYEGRSRKAEPNTNESEIVALTASTSEKIRDKGIKSVEGVAPDSADQVAELLK